MELSQLTRKKAIEALCLLFGTSEDLAQECLDSGLDEAKIQMAFRQRAFQFHPDRACQLGQSEASLIESFKAVASAKAVLLDIISGRFDCEDDGEEDSEEAGPCEVDSELAGRPEANRFYAGRLPQRPLLFAQFLYYSGWITWREMAEAIAWQRSLRPKFGSLALDMGILKPQQLARILRSKAAGEPIGIAALRVGILRTGQRDQILRRQGRLQRPIGIYFVERGIFWERDILKIARSQRQHNAVA